MLAFDRGLVVPFVKIGRTEDARENGVERIDDHGKLVEWSKILGAHTTDRPAFA